MNINRFNKRYKTEPVNDDILAGDSSLYVRRLPKDLPCKFTQYDTSSEKLAIVIPLFARYKKSKGALQNVPSVKYAMWSRWSLQQNTNIFEENIPVIFYIEDVLYETHKAYFEKHGLKEWDFIIFTTRPDTKEEVEFYHHYRCNLGLCQLPVIAPELQKYERVLIIDSDLFFCKTSHGAGYHDILSITEAVPKESIALLGIDNFVDGLNIDVGNPKSVPKNWLYSTPNGSEMLWWKLLNDIYPDYPAKTFNRVSGVWLLFSPEHHGIGTDYGKHVRDTIYTLRNDEATTGTYLQLAPKQFHVYRDVPYFGPDDTPLKAEEQQIPYYWFHIRHKRNLESVFRYHLGDIPV